MSKRFGLLGIMLSAGLLLTACDEPKTYQYFMQHPLEIKPVLSRCQDMGLLRAKQDKVCVDAIQAEQDVQQLLLKAEQSGQKYGSEVIQLQSKLSENKQLIKNIQEKLEKLKDADNNKQEQIAGLQQQLSQAKQRVAEQQQTLKQLLAVLSLLGP